MKYLPLATSFFKRNRTALSHRLKPGSVLVLHSNDIFPTNADGTFPLHQNANFFYLTGIDQEESVLVMQIEEQDAFQATLFLRETNEQIAIWEGSKLSISEARNLSGIDDVRWTSSYNDFIKEILPHRNPIYIETNEHPRCTNPVQTRNMRLGETLRKDYPGKCFENLYGVVAEMRLIKQPEELLALQQACDITAEGFTAALRHIKPGMGEWEVEALLSYEYLKRRARKFSFLPILASGSNSCVLHYTVNDQILKDGDLLLMDIGAEYGNYNGDMTRTIPVSGKFTPRQRNVYEAVLRIMNYALSIMRPGIQKSEYERLIRVYVGKELVDLGLLAEADLLDNPNDPPAVKKYFMHGCSHSLGLDVHDVGPANPIFEEGMVFTVEPGIYIREESIGIRLENDVVIGVDGNVNLLAKAPLSPDEIEEIMAH